MMQLATFVCLLFGWQRQQEIWLISIVFDLGVDPEGRKVSYSISGPYFSVERDSGIVKLTKELDRETLSELETIITITGRN